jgi:two-component system alkaline phosphatase synthesis response regulator PhoP
LSTVLRRRAAPLEVIAAGDRCERFESWTPVLADAGIRLSWVDARLESVLAALRQRRPAAMVLDLTDAEHRGIELLGQVRFRDEFAALPVLYLLPEPSRLFGPSRPGGRTADSAAAESLTDLLLRSGEFVFAPGGPFEIAVRLGRLVREPGDASSGVLCVGPITMDEAGRRVQVSGREVGLRKKEYDLLLFLARNAGTVFTREALLRWVWGPGFAGDARTVDVHVRRLRSKLGDSAGAVIETVRRVGYRLSQASRPNPAT